MEEIKKVLETVRNAVKSRSREAQMLLEDKDDYVLTPTNTRHLEGEIEACYDILDEIDKIADSYGVKL